MAHVESFYPLLIGRKASVIESKERVCLNAALRNGCLDKRFLIWRSGRNFELRFAGDAEAKFIARQRDSQIDPSLEQEIPDVVINIDANRHTTITRSFSLTPSNLNDRKMGIRVPDSRQVPDPQTPFPCATWVKRKDRARISEHLRRLGWSEGAIGAATKPGPDLESSGGTAAKS
jgi:hypothetical protein